MSSWRHGSQVSRVPSTSCQNSETSVNGRLLWSARKSKNLTAAKKGEEQHYRVRQSWKQGTGTNGSTSGRGNDVEYNARFLGLPQSNRQEMIEMR